MTKSSNELEGASLALISLLTPIAEQHLLEVLDVECSAELIRVTLEDPLGTVDSSRLAGITPQISAVVDTSQDVDSAYPGNYLLEVSTPGLERILRTPEHFRRYIGTKVNVKTKAGSVDERRFAAWITMVDGDKITFGLDSFISPQLIRVVSLGDIDRVKTIFEWHGAEKKTNSGNGTAKK